MSYKLTKKRELICYNFSTEKDPKKIKNGVIQKNNGHITFAVT